MEKGRSKSKRILALLLAAVFILTILSACMGETPTSSSDPPAESQAADSSSGSSGDGAGTDTPADADPYAPMPERITMTIGRNQGSNDTYEAGDNSDNNYVSRYMGDALNIDYQSAFTVSGTGDAYKQKVSLVIASGDLPDTMTVDETQYRQLASAGVIEDMTDVLNAYMSDSLKELYDTTGGYALQSATIDGRIMGIPNVSAGADAIPLLYVRDDWMAQAGLGEPKTLDDIVNIVKTFKELGLGGDGASGLVCQEEIVTVGNSMYGMDALFALHHSYPELWITDDSGNLMYGSIAPETRDALETIAGLVADGVIDKQFAVRDQDQCNELVTGGKSGIFFGPWWNLNWPLLDMSKSDPNISWSIYAAPLDSDGKYNTHLMAPTINYQVVRKGYEWPEAVVKTCNMQVDVDADQGLSIKPRTEATFSWQMMPFNLLLTGYDTRETNSLLMRDYVDGVLPVEEMPASWQNQYDSIKLVEGEGLQAAFDANNMSPWAFWEGCYALGTSLDYTNRVMGTTYSKASPTMEMKWATLEKLEDETFLQIITGEKPIEAFDEFVKNWKSLGGDDITAELAANIG
ncbi:MAG: extracellular solute-binding protein [Oscillospiraceae bacterium]